mgnify:CR=1 FL=1
MTKPLNISALPMAAAPARVIGAVPPIMGAGECVTGMACWAQYNNLSTASSEWESGVVGSEYSKSVG